MDVVAALQEQAERTSRLVRSVRQDQLGLSTPCPDWDVRGLINHLCLSAEFCARVAKGERFTPDYEVDFVGDDPGGAYDRWKDAMVEACSDPGLAERTVHTPQGDFPGGMFIPVALMETVVHRWDLARALGVDAGIPDDVADAIAGALKPVITDAMRASSVDETTELVLFGPEVKVPADAAPVGRLVALLGRDPQLG